MLHINRIIFIIRCTQLNIRHRCGLGVTINYFWRLFSVSVHCADHLLLFASSVCYLLAIITCIVQNNPLLSISQQSCDN